LRFVQVDAFADRPFTGNPAAVMPLERWLDDATLQAIAAENNLAETAFLVPADGDAHYELRWFTPVLEVVMCGHATLASAHVLLTDDPAREEVRFRTRKAGILSVSRNGASYNMALPAWRPSPSPLVEAAAALGGGEPVATLWNDRGYAVLVYEDEAAVRALTPDFRALGAQDSFMFIATAPGSTADVVSRAFVPGAGVDEDPVTGSAHAVIAPWWAERLGRASFSAYQASRRGGHLHCAVEGDRVILGGRCVTVIEGLFAIP
jgi:PhzF family phenazine biosynthesis protein